MFDISLIVNELSTPHWPYPWRKTTTGTFPPFGSAFAATR